jgi:hypothetical protein
MPYLRTTSLLERLNRTIRHRMRHAAAGHSRTGLQAMLVHVLIQSWISTAKDTPPVPHWH